MRYTDKALSDLEAAVDWYEGRQKGLGLEFLSCVEATIGTIQSMPELFANHHESFRRALIRRFPYSVFYTIEPQEIVVHAVFGNRQDPEKLP